MWLSGLMETDADENEISLSKKTLFVMRELIEGGDRSFAVW